MKNNSVRSNEDLITAIDHMMYKPEYTFFWGHTKSRNELTATCLSQWYPATFDISSLSFPTAEHYMMATKAALHNDEDSIGKILKARGPSDAKRLGRRVKNFDEQLWNDRRMDVVVTGNYEKFKQNPDLMEYLLSTGNTVLVEASPVDKVWGIGMGVGARGIEDPRNWRGSNLLGYALMEVRDRLRGIGEVAESVESDDDVPTYPPPEHNTRSKVMGEYYSPRNSTEQAEKQSPSSPYKPYNGWRQFA